MKLDDQYLNDIKESCIKNGVPELISEIKVAFNNRFTRRVADAALHNLTIRISTKLWERATLDQRKETIVHETCHLIAYYKALLNGNLGIEPHGVEWKTAMETCGVVPNVYHEINRDGLHRPRKLYTLYCECHTHKVYKKLFHQFIQSLNEHAWVCLKCNTKIKHEES